MSFGEAPILVCFAGLPGVGKSTVARALALALAATYLRVDTVERELTAGGGPVGTAGYRVLQRLAADNLALRRDVVADSVNPVLASREGFAACARESGAQLIDVEVICSDVAEHRRRVEGRHADDPACPAWADVTAHLYEPWMAPRIMLDTARRDPGASVALLLAQLCR